MTKKVKVIGCEGEAERVRGMVGDFVSQKEAFILVRFDGFKGHKGEYTTMCEKGDCWYLPIDDCEIIEVEEIGEIEEPKTLSEIFEDQFTKEKETKYTAVEVPETNVAIPLVFETKKLVVVYVDKEMTSAQCIKHAKVIEEHLGFEYKVLVVDRKVSKVEVL